MITGTLMYDISISVKGEEEQDKLVEAIKASLKKLDGITEVELVDYDIVDSSDDEDTSEEE